MRRTQLGKLAVSPLGLGTVKFGRNEGVIYPQPFELPSDAEIANLLALAQDLGINLLDTAPAYGMSEERLGNILCGQRHNWVVSTKVGEEFINGESIFDFSSAAMIKSVERSLKRLHTDYLDIVLVHSNGADKQLIEEEHVFTTLETLKKSGKIRMYGMSTKTVAGGLMTIELADLAMVTLNTKQQSDSEVITKAHQLNKGILIKKALGSGHLAAKQKNLEFIFSTPGVSSVIIGTINPDHLKQNVKLVSEILNETCECV